MPGRRTRWGTRKNLPRSASTTTTGSYLAHSGPLLVKAFFSRVSERIPSTVIRTSWTNDATERVNCIVTRGDQHPLHPGFTSRFRANAATAPDEIVAHVEDAVTCLEAGVLRPALMMIGLANEETIRITHAAMAHQGTFKVAPMMTKARDLLAEIEVALKTWPGSKDEHHRLQFAAVAIESIRVERNAAAHPGNRVTIGRRSSRC